MHDYCGFENVSFWIMTLHNMFNGFHIAAWDMSQIGYANRNKFYVDLNDDFEEIKRPNQVENTVYGDNGMRIVWVEKSGCVLAGAWPQPVLLYLTFSQSTASHRLTVDFQWALELEGTKGFGWCGWRLNDYLLMGTDQGHVYSVHLKTRKVSSLHVGMGRMTGMKRVGLRMVLVWSEDGQVALVQIEREDGCMRCLWKKQGPPGKVVDASATRLSAGCQVLEFLKDTD